MPQVPIADLIPPKPAAQRWFKYPAVWLRTERFWMEVTTRTIAGVLSVGFVAVIGYMFAVLGGYVDGPKAIERAVAIGASFILAVVISLSNWWLFKLFSVIKRRSSKLNTFIRLSIVLVPIFYGILYLNLVLILFAYVA